MLAQLNDAVSYIERNLGAEVDLDEAARIACVTTDSLERFFSYMTGMTIREYVRRRRLTLAARALENPEARVIDVAIQYGYDSTDAFTRAFTKQHGVTPSAYRKQGGSLKVYPPASFQITIKGAQKMDMRMIELKDTKVYGLSRPYDGEGYADREEMRHILWSEEEADVPGKLCEGTWNEQGSTAYDGTWYGLWQNGRYMVAREPDAVKEGDFEESTLPAGTYAAFTTECGGKAWEELPRLFDLIFESWLPSSGYRRKGDTIVEVYHLWTDHKLRHKKRYYEVWIPVERAE